MLRLGLPTVRTARCRFFATSKLPLSAKIAALLAKTSPEQIYLYKPSRLMKVGSWTLAGVFAVYGVSFADWSLTSSWELYREERLTSPEKWWKHSSLLLSVRIAGSILLSIIPLTLSALAIYVPSRIATSVTYLPKGVCQITRRALISGKPTSTSAPVSSIVRNKKTRVFTGVGPQGTEDKASFAFLLTNTDRPTWDRFYVVNRSGKFWGEDGRIFDVLFGGESVKSLERNMVNMNVTPAADHDPSHMTKLIEQQSRSKLRNPSINARSIVMKDKK
ncbi:LAME_0H15720g1_1 [Lachancea meyersii CBS 8951]|uniref:LAME_0H15720g1_1 n=1 Tax=Lachancea meyersii CBS 8951 TaxID=1266667 RepID=A0A1G4KHW7_9SACH|nr:LAME_0H15720g1_1 [Lachancea meyersii CBS 8951]